MTEDILRKIRGLLAKAESTTIDAEAETFREAAARLMSKYQIDEAQLIASGHRVSGEVEERVIPFGQVIGRDFKIALVSSLAELHQGRAINMRPANATKKYRSEPGGVILVGDPNDMMLVEMMWTSLCLQLDIEAARFIRQHSGRGVHGRTLRLSFVAGWVDRVIDRLEALYGEVAEENDIEGTGTALVLRDKKLAADDYVSRELEIRKAVVKPMMLNAFAMEEGEKAGNRADIGQTKVGTGTRPQLPGGQA